MIPFREEPREFHARNAPSAMQHTDFVDGEVQRLLEAGIIARVALQPPGVCGLAVEDSRTKLRLIFNGVPVNKFVIAPKFKYESVRDACDLVVPGDLVVQFDLHAAYHHGRIWPWHVGWLGVEWRGHFYVFLALPFGLSSAPHAFTKLTRPVVRYLRANGVRCVLMLDDGLVVLRPSDVAQVAFVRDTITRAGFTIAEEKSNWVPSPRAEAFLGYTIDIQEGTLAISRKRVEKLTAQLSNISVTKPVRRRELASLAGRITSTMLVLGGVTRLHTRAMHELSGGDTADWDARVAWSPSALQEVAFWKEMAAAGGLETTVSIWQMRMPVDVIVHSDAGERGAGVVSGAERLPFHLPAEYIGSSSTLRELWAVLAGVRALAPSLRDKRVRWCTDNQAAARILQIGSPAADCQAVA
ncbi:MAG: reverse transcriptase domain-containing protein, partial [Burkholderiales bacterium]